jgi:hypothetical protein
MAVGPVGGGGAVQAPQTAAAAPAAGAAPADAGAGAQEIDENMLAELASGQVFSQGMEAMGEAQKIESKNLQRQKEALAELKKEG